MTRLMAPRLKVVGDRDRVKPQPLGRNPELHQAPRSELLRRRLISNLNAYITRHEHDLGRLPRVECAVCLGRIVD